MIANPNLSAGKRMRLKRSGCLGKHARRGAAVVEFAIVVNVMFVLVFVCIEFARLNMMRNLAQDAAYFAARTAMVPGATDAEAQAAANQLLGIMNTQNAQVVVNGGGGIDDATSIIEVRVTVPLTDNALFVPMFTGNRKIEATARMKTERYDGFFDPNA